MSERHTIEILNLAIAEIFLVNLIREQIQGLDLLGIIVEYTTENSHTLYIDRIFLLVDGFALSIST